MIEVTARLRFNNFSLGAVRCRNLNKMLRDPEGRVMYMPTWWAALMRYAAKVLNRHQQLVGQIDWDPIIDGTPRNYRRYYGPSRYTLHEAFYPGDEIGVNAVLPSGIIISDFTQLLDVAGRYRGISPYKPKDKWGTFEVANVTRRRRNLSSREDSEDELALTDSNK